MTLQADDSRAPKNHGKQMKRHCCPFPRKSSGHSRQQPTADSSEQERRLSALPALSCLHQELPSAFPRVEGEMLGASQPGAVPPATKQQPLLLSAHTGQVRKKRTELKRVSTETVPGRRSSVFSSKTFGKHIFFNSCCC